MSLSLRIPQPLRLRLDEAKAIWHGLLGNIFSPYRPELHYMRGQVQSGTQSIGMSLAS